MKDGSIISEEINVADAHPAGKRPFSRKEYIDKFKSLTEGIISKRSLIDFKVCTKSSKIKSKRFNGFECRG